MQKRYRCSTKTQTAPRLPVFGENAKLCPMIRLCSLLAIALLGGGLLLPAHAQSPAPSAGTSSETADLLSLSKKIDEQNTKIDLLSQQILRLQQEIEHPKAIALGSPLPTTNEAPVATAVPAGGATHVVTRGETLISIAKMHKVTVDELQKLNHIENERKLQIGQTLVIPGPHEAATPSPSPTPAAPGE
jgi:LysM repeat protein